MNLLESVSMLILDGLTSSKRHHSTLVIHTISVRCVINAVERTGVGFSFAVNCCWQLSREYLNIRIDGSSQPLYERHLKSNIGSLRHPKSV